jgi:hypothetical protein
MEDEVLELQTPVVENEEDELQPEMSDQEAFVRAALVGNAVDAQDIANQLIAQRVGIKIDDMRTSVAANLIQPGADSYDDESNPES